MRAHASRFFVLAVLACFPTAGVAGTITEIISGTNKLYSPYGIAIDDSGNAYVVGAESDNAFKVTPDGLTTEIIDSAGDGMGNPFDNPSGIAVDSSGNVYITGSDSDNAFKITPDGIITEIIDSTGDGLGNTLRWTTGVAVDNLGNAYVTGGVSDNAFKRAGDLGACCDTSPGPTEACTHTTLADCDCESCTWNKGASCDQIECVPYFQPIPTASGWGLGITALLLLTAAKIHFGRRFGLMPSGS